MKSIAKAILVGSLIVATQAAVAAGSAFPEGAFDGEYGIPAQSTYADTHANDPVTSVGSAFPEGAFDGEYGIPARSTYADTHLGNPVQLSQPAQPADTSAD